MNAGKGAGGYRKLSRREFLGLGAAGAGLMVLGGCGGGERGAGAIELAFTSSPDQTKTAQKLVEQFNEQNRGRYRVIYREGNADTGQRFDQLRTRFQAGGEGIDVIGGDVIWTAQLAANGWVSDLSDRFTGEMRADFLPGSVEAEVYEGRVWGMPWFTDTGLMYYRKDLLEKSGFDGPPKTWDELKQMATKVKRDSGTRYGFVFQGANYEGGLCNGLEYVWGAGGDVLDPDDATRVAIDSPEAIAGLEVERGMVADGIAPLAVSNYREDESAGAFLNGDAVFLRNWSYVYALLGDPEQTGLEPEQVGVSELPAVSRGGQGFGTVGDQPLYISATSDKQDAAWEFVKFLAAPEQQKLRALEGAYPPTLKELYDDPEIAERVPIIPRAKKALLHTKPRPVSPYYSDISLEIAEQFNASLKGDVSPEQAAQALQTNLEELIKKGEQAS